MTLPFAILAGLTVGSAIAAMSLRNLVHCALSLVLTFAGLAGLFLQLNAEFVGFVQILVYVGAVAILMVFAILLTRGADSPAPAPIATALPWAVGIAVAVYAILSGAVTRSPEIARRYFESLPRPDAGAALVPATASMPSVPVKALGERLMGEYVLPLEVLGLLLTAAMIGAVIIAMQEKRK